MSGEPRHVQCSVLVSLWVPTSNFKRDPVFDHGWIFVIEIHSYLQHFPPTFLPLNHARRCYEYFSRIAQSRDEINLKFE